MELRFYFDLGDMMKRCVAALTALLILTLISFANAADSDTGETSEIKFSSTDALGLKNKADELGSPVKIYEYLLNNTEYALYHGSRSGSINSFMGLRGNDVDLASALIAMLRSRGIHARYTVGNVRIATPKVMNWLGVKNADLAASIMKDQGIQNIVLSTDKTTIDFEHVWVEALISYGNYRGAGQDATVSCTTASNTCRWVSLDPSFKQNQYNNQNIDIYNSIQFDYSSYYSAIKNNDPKFREKNPLEIYEEQILDYLKTNNPGKTLEDVADAGTIIQQNNLILPASLPYAVISIPRRYNSVADHDAAVGITEVKKWNKHVKITVDWSNGGGGINTAGGTVSLVDASTNRLTLTYELKTTPQGFDRMVTRLGGVEIAVPLTAGSLTINGQLVTTGFPFAINLEMDGAPATTAGGTDHVIKVAYQNCVVGGYYLIATGGETSNWSQVHRAAEELLQANQQHNIINDSSGVPYVDINGNGVIDAGEPRLLDNRSAMDALTGGLLYVAGTQYYAKFREQIERADNLNKVKTPIEGFVGVVSSVYDVDYLNNTAFSIMPGGLLIDMKGIKVNGLWRIEQPATYSNKHFELVGHIGSSLEHEIWQEITGYDAVSTVRGIQMTLANGATLANPKKNLNTDTVASAYSAFGFTSGAAPSGFTYTPLSVYTTNPATWTNATEGASFDTIKASVDNSTSSLRTSRSTYSYSSNSGLYGWSNCIDNYESQLLTLISQGNGNYNLGTQSLCNGSFSGTVNQYLSQLQTYYQNTVIPNYIGQNYFNFFDIAQGFQQSDYVTRANPIASDAQSTQFVQQIRNNLYLADLNTYWHEYLIPSKLTVGDTFRFSVYLDKIYDTPSGNLTSQSFIITNQGVVAHGGYVDGSQAISQSTVPQTISNVLPTFNNAVFTDQNTIAQTNNDVVKTPSTADPVSTVTGNNYHDETDLTVKGRGLNIAFTRTYNSAPSSTNQYGPLGYGWTHSYGMKLKSNDYGDCPNCAVGTGVGQRSENGNGKTSSITYLDERGGEHNYLVNESTYGVTPPKGEFDTLAFDAPSVGYHTITFRNGVQYIFLGSSDIKSVPGRSASLYQIKDPYGNSLTFGYTGGNLTGITDSLNRTVTIGYTGNRISSLSDWSGRSWAYAYDASSNLQSVTNPLNKTIQYTYHPGSHNLNEVILPETRNGQQVKTAFSYYQNGKTFNYSNTLGHTETLDYDLYRKSTRVTDPRGFIRQYEYDANGLMTKLTEPDNAILQFENSADGLRFKKYDGLGYATTYSYRTDRGFTGASDTGGQVTLEKDALTNTLEYSYGLYDQISRTKDKNGNVRIMDYYSATNPATDAVRGKLQSVTLGSLSGTANVLLQSYTYYPDGNLKQLTEQIDPANPAKKRITDYVWQDNGLNLKSVTVSGSGKSVQTTYTYDSLGRRKSATLSRRTSASDATMLPLTTSYDYDNLDRVTRVTDVLGNYVETTYDGNGKVYQIKGYYKKPDNTFDVHTIATRAYDAADRLVSETDIYGNVTRYVYDQAGNLIKTTDANDHIIQYEYDAMNRRTAIIDANGNRSATMYDLAGNPIQTIDPLGMVVKTEYDALGRLKISDTRGHLVQFDYDANGNITRMIDANATAGSQPRNSYNATLYKEYDELNRIKREVDALNGVTAYSYDLLGNITSITDAENHTTSFIYNDLGQLTEVRDPLYATTGKAKTFTYDEAGNVLTSTKRSGIQAVFTYDLLNRLTQAQYGSITETTIYDIYGNKQSVSNPDVTYSYEYDLKNRPTRKTDSRVNKSLSYTYGRAGEALSKTNYDGSTTEYRYDSANRLVAERNSNFLEVSYQYDSAGKPLSRILSNGAKTSYIWDNYKVRLYKLVNTAANGTIVNSTTYGRDMQKNIIGQTDSTGTTSFTYDALYRLTSANYPGSANDQSFSYDKVGNRKTLTKAGTTIAYIHDAGNRLKEIRQGTATGPILNSFDYDDDGNTTAKRNSSGAVIQSFTYDAKGRVKTITTGSATQSMSYDPYDYRIAKTDSQGTKTYLLEGEHLEAVMRNGQWQAKYLRGAVVDEVVNGYQFDVSGTWTNYTFHHDALQSVVGLSGHDGAVLQGIGYNAFGDKQWTSGSGNNNHLNYTGREEDQDSGLYYYRARYYDPSIGRFISEDPKGFGAGVNFFAYVQNNPINANDPMGLIDEKAAIQAGIGLLNSGAGLTTGVIQLCGGASLCATPEPTGITKLGGAAFVTIGTANVVNSSVGLLNESRNLYHAFKDEQSGLPGNFFATMAQQYASDSQIAKGFADVADLSLAFISGRAIPMNSISKGIIKVFDWFQGFSVGSTGYNYVVPSETKAVEQPSSSQQSNMGASGGFVIYPNKVNLNMIDAVYHK